MATSVNDVSNVGADDLVYVVKNSSAGSHTYAITPPSGYTMRYPEMNVAVAQNPSATSPLDAYDLAGGQATATQNSGNAVTSSSANDLVISFAYTSNGGSSVTPVTPGLSTPSGTSFVPSSQIATGLTSGTTPYTSTWTGFYTGGTGTANGYIIDTFLIH